MQSSGRCWGSEERRDGETSMEWTVEKRWERWGVTAPPPGESAGHRHEKSLRSVCFWHYDL